MKVLLDATAIPADLGGVGRYVDDLVPELIACGVNLAMAVQQRDVAHFSAKVPRAHLFPVSQSMESRGARMAWEQTGLPALIRRIRPDVLHSPHYTPLDWLLRPIRCHPVFPHRLGRNGASLRRCGNFEETSAKSS